MRAYRINDYLHRMVEPAHREAFMADPEASFEAAGLTDEERDLIRRRDWRGLLHYGVIFFMLEKLGAVTGVSNLHIYAAMRGQSLEDFQRTRNAPGALYSVAGKGGWKARLGQSRKKARADNRPAAAVVARQTLGAAGTTRAVTQEHGSRRQEKTDEQR